MLFIRVCIMLFVHALSMTMTAIGCYCITWAHGHYNIKYISFILMCPHAHILAPKNNQSH